VSVLRTPGFWNVRLFTRAEAGGRRPQAGCPTASGYRCAGGSGLSEPWSVGTWPGLGQRLLQIETKIAPAPTMRLRSASGISLAG
jgi:hypothetical protein